MALEGWRYEIKFATTESELSKATVASWVRTHPAGFRTTYPPRQVNNIYFDTRELPDLDDHLAGVPDRAKLRLRWYGTEHESVTGRIEHKQKRNWLGRKVAVDVKCPLDLTQMAWREILDSLAGLDLGPLAITFRTRYRPVVINTYWREYFASADSQVRLTMDTRLNFYSQVRNSKPNLRWRTSSEDLTVIEVKSDADQQERLRDVIARFPLRATAHSKYVRGVLGAYSP